MSEDCDGNNERASSMLIKFMFKEYLKIISILIIVSLNLNCVTTVTAFALENLSEIKERRSPTYCYNIQELDKEKTLRSSLTDLALVTTFLIAWSVDTLLVYNYYKVDPRNAYAYLGVGYLGLIFSTASIGTNKNHWSGKPASPCTGEKEYLYFVIHNDPKKYLESQCSLKSIEPYLIDRILKERVFHSFHDKTYVPEQHFVDTFKNEAKFSFIRDEKIVEEYNNCLLVVHLPGGHSRIAEILKYKE
jgi:hypothetical protein